MSTPRIYSIGYEGSSIATFVETLAQNRVTLVVNVRLNAVSRRPGFSKRKLESALTERGIGYVHERALGNPPENRAHFHSPETVDEGRRNFRAQLDNGSHEALERLVDHARSQRVAVLCVERAAAACHRTVITDAALELNGALEVIQVL